MRHDADVLAALSRPTVGLGCATLGGTVSVPDSVRVIAAAVEGGVRHLDVARSYGYGQAETAVGRFLRGAGASGVTVTTKVGIRPPGGIRQVKALRAIARVAADLSPTLKRRIAVAASGGVAASRFGLDDLESSLQQSLAALQLGRVDVLLLHECTDGDVTDEVLAWLEGRIALGDVGTWGIATGVEHAEAIASRLRVPVVQVPASPSASLPAAFARDGAAVIRHSVLSTSLRPLDRVLQDPALRARAEERSELSLGTADLPRVLLALAMASPPAGLVLVGTRRAEHARVLGGVEPLSAQQVAVLGELLRTASAATPA